MQTNFATMYELLHDPQFYQDWLKLLQSYVTEKKAILDLGCGNGMLLSLLQAQGHEVSGVDVSADMLTLAKEKLGPTAELYENDMVEFFTKKARYDIIISTCDSLNYLASIKDIEQVFRQVHAMLKPGGFFFFDIHSDYTFCERFMNWHYGADTERASFIWDIHVSDGNMYEHDLIFFLLNEGGLYERYDSIQVEYFYPVASEHFLFRKNNNVK